ncbi:MAG: DUF4215 domain-containing protein [Nannocystaceae bacterium]
MRRQINALAALPLVAALACNTGYSDSLSASASDSDAGSTSSASGASGPLGGETDPITTQTASASATDGSDSASSDSASASATDGSASASASASATDGSASASATDGSDSATDSASATDGTDSDATGTTGDSGDTTGDSDATDSGVTVTDTDTDTDTNGCPAGTEGCACLGDNTCEGDLLCDAGTCVVDAEPVCGNGVVEPGEECDDGNDDDLDGCTSECEDAPVCTLGTEGCPCDGQSCNAGLMCEAGTCVEQAMAVCGNGVVEPGEECDDGNQQPFDSCANNCVATSFGTDPCGFAEDGVWVDINYKNSGSCWSPSWKFSNTPGFGEAQWAPTNENYPVINAAGGPVMNYNDPYGTVCDVGSSKWIRIMFGLASLISYESATVCVEGRSISVGSPVTVDLVNPDNGYCGAQIMLSNSWWADPAGAELPLNCIKPGDAFQALQIDPSAGSNHLGLRSVRLTLHKPVF